MGWGEGRASVSRFRHVPIVLLLAAPLGGCFQPLYGTSTETGRPAVRDALSSIEVQQIEAAANTSEAPLAVQIRNDLLFNFTGGGYSAPPTHKLKVQIYGNRAVVVIDRATALPNVETYTGQASTPVSYDTLGQQRFARLSGMHDAERKAAKVVSDNITTRLASYFISGS
jgi:LPS-assembly lipoprotein